MSTNAQDTTSNNPPTAAEIEAELERTRADLAATVDELTSRLDVKTRVKESVQQSREQAAARVRTVRDQATDDRGRPTSTTLAVAGGVAAVILAVVVLGRRRRR